ncbi:tetratricopeptide repeat protein [Candidatus Haliotispira prima]|uniref:Tetratricopeptide repeat protein n=1 Tax=Candidatus Haliotispira prima TaxID=3034016 RepID=A0ABY8MEZ5_9SPIO|nr:tetratricopeptide repeat protein [Candidatus Haliotispira prima]
MPTPSRLRIAQVPAEYFLFAKDFGIDATLGPTGQKNRSWVLSWVLGSGCVRKRSVSLLLVAGLLCLAFCTGLVFFAGLHAEERAGRAGPTKPPEQWVGKQSATGQSYFTSGLSGNSPASGLTSAGRRLLESHFAAGADSKKERPKADNVRKQSLAEAPGYRGSAPFPERILRRELQSTLQGLRLQTLGASAFMPVSVGVPARAGRGPGVKLADSSMHRSRKDQYAPKGGEDRVTTAGRGFEPWPADPYSFSFTAGKLEVSRPGMTQSKVTYSEALPQRRDITQAYGVLLEARPGRSFFDGKQAFMRGNYWWASEIMMENRYTADAIADPYYLNWLLKSLLAARRLELIPPYLKQYRLRREVLRESSDERDAELFYLIGRYHFALGDMRLAREIFIDYLNQFSGSYYVPQNYYWIARSLEREEYLEEARTVYLLVVSYFSRHYLNSLAKYKAGVISLRLLKKQAEDFLRSRGVNWGL